MLCKEAQRSVLAIQDISKVFYVIQSNLEDYHSYPNILKVYPHFQIIRTRLSKLSKVSQRIIHITQKVIRSILEDYPLIPLFKVFQNIIHVRRLSTFYNASQVIIQNILEDYPRYPKYLGELSKVFLRVIHIIRSTLKGYSCYPKYPRGLSNVSQRVIHVIQSIPESYPHYPKYDSRLYMLSREFLHVINGI